MYLTQGRTHQTKALEFDTRQRTAVRNSIFVGWYNLQMYAIHPKIVNGTMCLCITFGNIGRLIACCACRRVQCLPTVLVPLVKTRNGLATRCSRGQLQVLGSCHLFLPLNSGGTAEPI